VTGWFLLGLVLKVTVLLAAGLVAVRALRARSAVARHAVLVATIGAAAALPVLGLALPGWDVPLFAPEAEGPVARSAMGAVAARIDGAGHAPTTSMTPVLPAPEAARIVPSPTQRDRSEAASTRAAMLLPPARATDDPWIPALLATWAVGAALILGRFALDAARTRALRREALEAPDGVLSRECARIAGRLGIRRPVRILLSERLTVPVTWGALRPVVVLPLSAWEWEPERTRIALLHELAHVRRFDSLSSTIAVLGSAIWWFHPLHWVCRWRLRVEQERACDDIVLLDGVGQAAYAALLVDFARGLSRLEETTTARAAIAMARRSTLRERVETILATGSRSFRLDRRAAGLLVAAALALLLPVAAVHVWGETAEARRSAELVAELASPDPATREAAAWGLGAWGGEAAVEPLLARLDDPEPAVRGVAARSLGKLGDPRAFGPLVRLLDDPDPHVRELAILGLEDLPSDGVVAALVPTLRDPEMGVRSVAVSALEHLGGEAAARALAAVAERDPDRHARGMAIGALRKVEERDVAVPALVRLLDDPDVEIREGAAWALAEIGDPRAVPALVARLAREESGDVRSGIVDALAGHANDPRAVEGLLAAVRDPEYGVRHAAVAALAESDDSRAPAALVAALRDPVHQVRLEAEWSLDAIEARR
jgi:HEAT repeat protein